MDTSGMDYERLKYRGDIETPFDAAGEYDSSVYRRLSVFSTHSGDALIGRISSSEGAVLREPISDNDFSELEKIHELCKSAGCREGLPLIETYIE